VGERESEAAVADRRVTKTGKDNDGDITSLCSDQWWSPVSKAQAIKDIDNDDHRYYVKTGSAEADINVVNGATGKYLRTDPDKTTVDNLDDLPDC
jgi:hypothetical protein